MTNRRSGGQPDDRKISTGRLRDQLGWHVFRLYGELTRQYGEVRALRNLRTGTAPAMAIISANPGISQNEVAEAVGVDKSTMVQIMADLEARDFVRRERVPSDRRRHALFLTEAGEAYLDELIGEMDRIQQRLLHLVSPEELAKVNDILDRMHASYVSDRRLFL